MNFKAASVTSFLKKCSACPLTSRVREKKIVDKRDSAHDWVNVAFM